MEWTESNVGNQQVWLDPWANLRVSYSFQKGYSEQRPFDYSSQPAPAEYPYVLVTQLTRLRANRVGLSLPATFDYLKVYDNGVAQLYHRRPQTPYQR